MTAKTKTVMSDEGQGDETRAVLFLFAVLRVSSQSDHTRYGEILFE
jgi:hypothetical protein